MSLFAVSLIVIDFRYEVDRGIRSREVFGDAQGFGVVVHVAELVWKNGFRTDWKSDWWWDES